jgi:hypothetical protein
MKRIQKEKLRPDINIPLLATGGLEHFGKKQTNPLGKFQQP